MQDKEWAATPLSACLEGHDRYGHAHEVLLKCWKHVDGECWWDFTRVHDACGLFGESQNQQVKIWLGRHEGKLLAFCEHIGFACDKIMRKSLRALQAAALPIGPTAALPDCVHEVPTLSTVGMFLLLLYLEVAVKGKEVKAKIIAIRALWFVFALGADVDCQTLCRTLPDDVAWKCQPHIDGCCVHMNRLDREMDGLACSNQKLCLEYLLALYPVSSHCSAARAWLQRVVQSLSNRVDSRLEQLAYTKDPSKQRLPVFGEGPRHYHDEDLRRLVADVSTTGRARSGEDFLRSNQLANPKTAAKWDTRANLEYQAACWALGAKISSVSVALDASRVGQPAQETEVYLAIVHHAGERHMLWLPPQVPLGVNIRHSHKDTHQWQLFEK
eukprot:853390-Amphidinium_carterae.4